MGASMTAPMFLQHGTVCAATHLLQAGASISDVPPEAAPDLDPYSTIWRSDSVPTPHRMDVMFSPLYSARNSSSGSCTAPKPALRKANPNSRQQSKPNQGQDRPKVVSFAGPQEHCDQSECQLLHNHLVQHDQQQQQQQQQEHRGHERQQQQQQLELELEHERIPQCRSKVNEVSMKKVVDLLYDKVLRDDTLHPFFKDMNLRQLLLQQQRLMLLVFGGQELLQLDHPGFDLRATCMRALIEGGLSMQHWEAFAQHFQDTLAQLDSIPEKTKADALRGLYSTRHAFRAVQAQELEAYNAWRAWARSCRPFSGHAAAGLKV